ncbi:hypothetical protein ED21_23278 [Erythrobacter sp. SD-21]|nr:hypothetical protein ED21_23278 [Erythrobacter sp. SD-21]
MTAHASGYGVLDIEAFEFANDRVTGRSEGNGPPSSPRDLTAHSIIELACSQGFFSRSGRNLHVAGDKRVKTSYWECVSALQDEITDTFSGNLARLRRWLREKRCAKHAAIADDELLGRCCDHIWDKSGKRETTGTCRDSSAQGNGFIALAIYIPGGILGASQQGNIRFRDLFSIWRYFCLLSGCWDAQAN